MVIVTQVERLEYQCPVLRQKLKAHEAAVSKLQKKLIYADIKLAILFIELKIRDCKQCAQRMWQKMFNTVAKGKMVDLLSSSNDHQVEEANDEVALLHERIQKERSAIQVVKKANGTRAKVEQLSRKKIHYAAIMASIEKEEARIKEEVARCCTAVKQQECLLLSSRQAGQAFLKGAIRNRMDRSGVAEFYEDEIEKLRDMAAFLYEANACKSDCRECRKYKMDRCWWCP